MESRYEIGIFSNDNVFFADGKVVDKRIRRALAGRQIKSMDCFMPHFLHPNNQATWKLGINQKLHAETGSRRLIWLSRAA